MQAPDWPNRSAYSDLVGLRLLERADGTARVGVTVTAAHVNTNGTAHGGVVTSLVDTACGAAMAYQSSIGKNGVATISIQVNYLAPAFIDDELVATARCRGRGRRILTLDAEVRNQKDELVAIGLCTLRVRSSEKTVKREPA
jgi:acyl-CoA thioesterase